jgi:DNA uptake protein ComE-like DNA-binding protein
MTPEEKLCSRTWRLRNSAGLLWSMLSFGLLTGVGFLIRGVKSKNKAWIALGVGFLVVGIGVFATAGLANPGTKEAPIRTAFTDIWGWIMFANLVGGITAAVITNKKWLIWKAHANDAKWYAQAGVSQPAQNSSPVRGYDPNAAAAAFAPQATPPVTLAAPASAQVPVHAFAPEGGLDVNSASAEELKATLGVDAATVGRILAARQAMGSFTSFEQLMSKAQVPPHLLIPHRDKMTFGTPANAPAPQPDQPSAGRRSARKLFD